MFSVLIEDQRVNLDSDFETESATIDQDFVIL